MPWFGEMLPEWMRTQLPTPVFDDSAAEAGLVMQRHVFGFDFMYSSKFFTFEANSKCNVTIDQQF
jgi:hypothetical protein